MGVKMSSQMLDLDSRRTSFPKAGFSCMLQQLLSCKLALITSLLEGNKLLPLVDSNVVRTDLNLLKQVGRSHCDS
jgi:hypothetical protein